MNTVLKRQAFLLLILAVVGLMIGVWADSAQAGPDNSGAAATATVASTEAPQEIIPADSGIALAQSEAKAPEEAKTSSEDETYEDEDETVQIADPLSLFNRGMYHFNDKLYFWVLKPTAEGYAAVVPEGGRISVRNFFSNLGFPVRFVSSLLQGRFKSAGIETVRFFVNSTVGVFGLNDVAKEGLDLRVQDEDIGQALGAWQIGHGFYIVWPIIGPSSLRDTVGWLGDRYLDPVTYVDPTEASIGIKAYDVVNATSLRIGDYESLKEAVIDPYISIRNAYVQNRKKKVEE